MSKEAMKLALEGAANYIDALGGDSRKYRQTLAEPPTKAGELRAMKRDFWEGYVPEPMKPAQQGPVFSYTPDMDAVRRDEKEKADKFLAQLAQQALDKKAENARELGLDYEPAQKPVTPCTHPSLGFSSLREDGAASRWSCVMCGTEFVPKATQRWTEFNETTKRNIEHAEWYLSTHPEPAQQEPVARQYQNRDGVWKDFISEKHYKDTLEDGSWPIRNLYTSPKPPQRKEDK